MLPAAGPSGSTDFRTRPFALTLRSVNNFARRVAVSMAAVFAMLATFLGSVTAAVALPQSITAVATSVTALIGVVGGSSQESGVLIDSFGGFEQTYPSAAPEMTASARGFFTTGGTALGVYPASSNAPSDLIAAINSTSTPVNDQQPANLLVVPALGSLAGQNYYDVAVAMGRMAASLPAIAILDLPQQVVQAAMVNGDTAGPVAVAETLTKTLPDPAVAALYTAAMIDPMNGSLVPAAGIVAGVYAANDEIRRVWVDPAGEALSLAGYVPQWLPSDAQTGQMTPLGINSFRQSPVTPGTYVISGSRTLHPFDVLRRYLSQVRLEQFISASVANGLQWAIFETDGLQLWSQIHIEVSQFLATLQAQHAFGQLGESPESYFVTVNESNNTIADIAAGIVHVDIDYVSLNVPEYAAVNLQVQAGRGL